MILIDVTVNIAVFLVGFGIAWVLPAPMAGYGVVFLGGFAIGWGVVCLAISKRRGPNT